MAKIKLSELSRHLKGETLEKYNTAREKSIREWGQQMKEELKSLILETISRGQSPVQGGRGQTGGQARFYQYSAIYSDQIRRGRYRQYDKKLRPINLKLSGGLHRSIKTISLKDGFKIWFTSVLAKYHTIEGAGRSRIKRKMLPVDQGDEFTRLINKGLVDKFKTILTSNLKG